MGKWWPLLQNAYLQSVEVGLMLREQFILNFFFFTITSCLTLGKFLNLILPQFLNM